MFNAISTEVSDRVAQAEAVVRAIRNAEKAGGTAASESTRAAKGLVFVLAYAVYEYCVLQSFQAALQALNVHLIPFRDLRPATLALALDDECKSLGDKKIERAWPDRIALFERTRNETPASMKDTLFPMDGSHMRPSQLSTLWAVLGISVDIVPEPRFLGRIEELVEHRNAIAHGRERADVVGGRFSVDELADRVKDAGVLCQYIVATLQTHCADPANFR